MKIVRCKKKRNRYASLRMTSSSIIFASLYFIFFQYDSTSLLQQSKKKSTEMIIERKLRDLNEQYLFKCQPCLLGFKRRGMLVNHIAKYHPNITPDEVPELNLPIMKTTRDFYCHLCEKVTAAQRSSPAVIFSRILS